MNQSVISLCTWSLTNIVHCAILIGPMKARPSATVLAKRSRNGGLCDIIRAQVAKPNIGTPFVCQRFYTGMKGQGQLKHVFSKDFIDGSRRNSLHAVGRIFDIVGKVAIWIYTLFFSLVSIKSKCIGYRTKANY